MRKCKRAEKCLPLNKRAANVPQHQQLPLSHLQSFTLTSDTLVGHFEPLELAWPWQHKSGSFNSLFKRPCVNVLHSCLWHWVWDLPLLYTSIVSLESDTSSFLVSCFPAPGLLWPVQQMVKMKWWWDTDLLSTADKIHTQIRFLSLTVWLLVKLSNAKLSQLI